MVSTNPGQDYVNRDDYSIYAHQPVAHSGYYVLTHGSLAEKIADVKSALKELKFPPSAFLVGEI